MTIKRSIRLFALVLVTLAFTGMPPASRGQWSWPWSGGPASPAVVAVLDVGQGDAILVRSPEGKTALIDAGPTREGAVTALKREGIRHLDLVAISHHHSDHYGGMEEVIRQWKPRYFLASRSGHSTKTYLKLLQAVEAEGITAIQPTSRPRKIALGSVELTVFAQAPEDRREENNNSVGIRLKYGSFSVLLPGDGESPERRWWLEHEPDLVRDCTILKLAHHGSRNGTDAHWLDAVRPELAVASMGRNNEFGHPHPETVSLLRRAGIPLLRTDRLGTIAIESDGRSWKVVRPALLARRGRPTQDDVDRVAASTTDDAPTKPARRTRVR
ncbi:MAG TPA: ComEC/Rec2 family competence protein [Isosphaeraceae bacterium]|nr:ComEC/Rec2 family competence protein [Isosphaeraceae bacterium]